MNDLERDLAAMLQDRAGRVTSPADAPRVLQRARRRRVATAGTAGLLSLALVSGAFAALGRMDSADPVPPARTGDETFAEDLTSTPGEYPFVATGSFRDMQWKLRAAAVRSDDAGEVRLTFVVSSERGRHSTSGPLGRGYGKLVVNRLDERHALDPDVDALWGVARPGIKAVDVELDDGQGTMIPAHLFTRHDSRTDVDASFWVAFVPRDVPAVVIARDHFGTTRAAHELGHVTPPRHQVARGRVGDTRWYLSVMRGGGPAVVGSRRDEICPSVTDSGGGYTMYCIGRDDLRDPLYLQYLDTENVRVVAAILGDEIRAVRFRLGSRGSMLPVHRVAVGKTPLRLVVVGVPPEGSGYLDGIDRRGRVIFSGNF